MFIYNVTVKVDNDIAEQWEHWMRNKHLHDVMDTKKFEYYTFCRLLEQETSDGITFATQYFCKSLDILNNYLTNDAGNLREESFALFGNKFIAFRTVLEVIQTK